jgi:hypothetical protein
MKYRSFATICLLSTLSMPAFAGTIKNDGWASFFNDFGVNQPEFISDFALGPPPGGFQVLDISNGYTPPVPNGNTGPRFAPLPNITPIFEPINPAAPGFGGGITLPTTFDRPRDLEVLIDSVLFPSGGFAGVGPVAEIPAEVGDRVLFRPPASLPVGPAVATGGNAPAGSVPAPGGLLLILAGALAIFGLRKRPA